MGALTYPRLLLVFIQSSISIQTERNIIWARLHFPKSHCTQTMNIRIIILSAVTALAISCSPVHSVNRYGISATLIHGDAATPIAKTPVFVTIDDETFKRSTDSQGAISVPPDLRIRMSWLGGPVIQSDPEARIIVSCAGYDPLKIEWFRHLSHRNSGRVEDHGLIDLGKLSLNKSISQQVAP